MNFEKFRFKLHTPQSSDVLRFISSYYPQGIFIDLTCDHNKQIIEREHVAMNTSFRWLAWIGSEDFSCLNRSTLRPDSDMIVASDDGKLYDVYKIALYHPVKIIPIGNWTKSGRISLGPKQFRDLSGIRLRISVLPILANTTGYLLPNGKFTGYVGDVADNRSDLGAAPVQHFPHRADVIRYLQGFMRIRMIFLYLSPRELGTYKALIIPLSFEVWMLIIAITVIMIICYYYVQKYSNLKRKDEYFGGGLLYAVGIVSQQGFYDESRKLSYRMMGVFMLALTMIISAYYNAAIMNGLLSPAPVKIKTLRQLMKSDFKLGRVNLPYMQVQDNLNSFFTKEDLERISRDNNPSLQSKTGLLKVKTQKFAFAAEDAQLRHDSEGIFTDHEKCDLVEINLDSYFTKDELERIRRDKNPLMEAETGLLKVKNSKFAFAAEDAPLRFAGERIFNDHEKCDLVEILVLRYHFFFPVQKNNALILERLMNFDEFRFKIYSPQSYSALRFNSSHYTQGIFIDLTCDHNKQIIEREDAMNTSFRWLAWIGSEDFSCLNRSTLRPDSDMIVATDDNKLYDVYKITPYHPVKIIPIGNWTKSGRISLGPKQFRDLSNITLRVSVLPVLADNTGFILPNGRFNGYVGDIAENRSDTAAAPVQYFSHRADVIKYIAGLMTLRIVFLFLSPRELGTYKALILPFTFEVWMLIVAITVIMIICYNYVQKYSNLKRKHEYIGGGLLYAVGIVSQQGFYDESRKLSYRIMGVFLLILCSVISAYYSAQIMNGLLSPAPVKIKTVKQLMKSDFSLGLINLPYMRIQDVSFYV
ncbi:hypothetical protein O3M35_007694 [Rhynocoris fuscipes]|uniref:Ionotropic glutamate receptor C-terminal domain-containing protein n=1 Tax=Rhynocoris fuscipes TaxID=488301 RepID=A0AAW1DBP7_9HEMI